MSVPNHFSILQDFWKANAARFNFVHQEDCGKFTEEFLLYLLEETHEYHYAHLKKYGSATQYNGHAIDVIAFDNRSFDDGTDIMEIDIIGSAESADAEPTWQVRETEYTEEDLLNPDDLDPDNPNPPIDFPSYEDLGGDALCRELIGTPLAADYTEAHALNPAQPLIDDGVSVWTNRTVYDAINWVVIKGLPPRVAYQKSAEKRRPEWRAALGLPPLSEPRA